MVIESWLVSGSVWQFVVLDMYENTKMKGIALHRQIPSARRMLSQFIDKSKFLKKVSLNEVT